ncbi:bacteriocin family protein [Acidiferrimicrobium sp. IK]|uniref:family 1 encapsulin nanocompartment shell protein n=1 Tax=Acidiferrimicrobium sp. IK TaxID=2871700 RepID=UPI0021CB4044|nr:family 1 encapsulin nanocompartment shell protein [Acidiferrimicrobium sp. IK]MCU4184334.1 bacteriocin family protein [Acidiferrimicrobium sp. IK]
MNHLLRELAPISEAGWAQIEDEAKTRLTTYLAARRLVDFEGPHGWTHSAYNLGRTAPAPGPSAEVTAVTRLVQPLVEFRAPFSLSRAELATAERGNASVDLSALEHAARAIALAENGAVFHGYGPGGITGITGNLSHDAIHAGSASDGDGWAQFPKAVATGVERLLLAGIGGPYALALGDQTWVAVAEATERGSTLFDHLSRIVSGPIVWAPGIEGALVVSQRGGDFVLSVGQDLSIGYSHHDAETVTLYFEESFTFTVLEEDAAVHLVS